jgi:primosomal protein N'
MIADIADRQAESERHAFERCEPTWALPNLTADEAFAQIEAAVGQTILEALEYKRKTNSPEVLEILFRGAPRIAINCSTGTGKTKAMIAGITELLRTDAATRVVIAVPTHKLGAGLADRINTAYGSEVAAEWYGDECRRPPGRQRENVSSRGSSKRGNLRRW